MKTTTRILPLLLAATALPACSGANPATSDPPATRPASAIPADYVRVPGGYAHPSCVIAVADGESVLPDGDVRQIDGSIRAIAPCSFPSITHGLAERTKPVSDAVHVESTSGFTSGVPDTSTYFSAGFISGLTSATSSWTVPALPSYANAGESLHIYSGVYSFSGYRTLAAVLQFNDSANFGSTGAWKWTIASWDFGYNRNFYHSSAQIVNTGDQLQAFAGVDAATANHYTVYMKVNGSYSIAWLEGQTYNPITNVIGGEMDADGVSSCAGLPGWSYLYFHDIDVRDRSGSSISIPATSWIREYTNFCNYMPYAGNGWGYLTYIDN